MSLGGHPYSILAGIDRRALSSQRSDYYLGRIRWSDYGQIPMHEYSLALFQDLQGTSGSLYNGYLNTRPWVTSSPGFSTDNLGQSFPAGTVWVVQASPSLVTIIRTPVTAQSPITVGLGNAATTPVWIGGGIPAGAVGTITIKLTDGTVISTTTVMGSNGHFQYVPIPAYAASGGYTPEVNTSWTGGYPQGEALNPLTDAITAWAVPSTLPAAYTARLAHDTDRGGTFQARIHADRTRQLGGPNCTYATVGLSQQSPNALDLPLGIFDGGASANVGLFGISNYNAWINGALQALSWTPMAVGQATFSGATGAYAAANGQTPSGGSITTNGFRYLQVTYGWEYISQNPQPSDTLTITVQQDGATIFTITLTGSQIMTSVVQSIPVTVPPIGTTTTFTTSMTASTAQSPIMFPPYWIFGVSLQGSPRCDIPLPFSCLGPGPLVAPGGYYAAGLGAITNGQPLTYLGAGVTSTVISSSACLAFLPSANGFYQITSNGGLQSGIGEDERGYQDARTLQRGHAGVPFYCKISASGSTTVAIAPYSITPVALSSAPATINLATASHWGFASWAAPAAGTYALSLAFSDYSHLVTGLYIDLCTTDLTCVNYDRRFTLETFNEGNGVLNGITVKGTSATPPSSPAHGDCWGIIANATGAWSGHSNCMAFYDAIAGAWVFVIPRIGSYAISFSPTMFIFWNGSSWATTFGQAAFSITFPMTAGQQISIALSSFCTDAEPIAGAVTLAVTGPL